MSISPYASRLFVAESPFAKQRGGEAAWTALFGAKEPFRMMDEKLLPSRG